MNEDNLSEMELIPMENKIWLDDLRTPEGGLSVNQGAPVCELFSVEIYPHSRQTCEVYGEINIEDEDGTRNFYRRYSHNAQTLTLEHNTLSLNMIDMMIPAWKNPARMSISLKDRVDGGLIVEGAFNLDQVTKLADYDKVNVREVRGVSGHALVRYGVFLAASLASVKVEIVKKRGCRATKNICGRIDAQYGNTYGKRFPRIMLFNSPSSNGGKVSNSRSIALSRAVLAVPAYSFLRINVDLSDPRTNQPLVNDKVDFLVASHFVGNQSGDVEAKDFIIQVVVEWFHPYQVDQVKRIKHRPIGFELLEVFSVMICHNCNKQLNICGTMQISDGSGQTFFAFDKNELNPEILSTSMETIPVKAPSDCFDGEAAGNIFVDLRDDQDPVLIKGDVRWIEDYFERSLMWYDRRLCSVFRGVQGYAAVFYTMFKRAVQALVKASFLSSYGSPDDLHQVQGTIVARRSNEDYSTVYAREYYQSVLYKNPRGEFSKISSGCTIPLLKDAVAVPGDAFLIVEVDLYASSVDNRFPGEHLRGVAEFDIDPDARRCRVIKGKNCCIELSVEWSKILTYE